ncbi:general secretion pathway protein E [Inquilinus ginsengisoli]|uniref:General secretion pathway protein E n=1 Tax=Inquilinus ginsengisoli TaxID=363840 RepID=A0ABU1JQI0_9PROT|nr:ATPase, T2SS/T4P/T4SS family [Inquilinus ginsengisoli]MDR6290876.1 general secretion pathway protein E [Inquilinus ginsengisoli]
MDHVRSLVEILVELGKLGPDDIARLSRLEASSSEPVAVLVTRLGLVSSQDHAQALSIQYGLPLARRTDFPEAPVVADRLPARFLKDSRMLPIADSDGAVTLAMADPGDGFALRAVEMAMGKPVAPVVAAEEDLAEVFARWYESGRSSLERISDGIEIESDIVGDPDVEQLKDLAQEAPVIRLVNQVIADAVRLQASDIHLESYREELKLRYRIHGILKDMKAPPAKLAPALISRIKILARLDIAERRLPQDGRARFTAGGQRIDMRVATMPTMHGENVVIRLLDTKGMALDMGELGLTPAVEAAIRRHLAHPHGILLVTGPTGSGKTTTLYSALRILNQPSRKILTVEDPIEYQINGINQTNVQPQIGLDFARVLRSSMRHDPDVIMVGEIRDGETANIAVHAALTGHLVLSTLHTNSATGSINRLLDMGVDGYLLTSTIRGVIGQRLVRQLCTVCRSPYRATLEELAQLGLAEDRDVTLHRAIGCPACDGLGYTSRIGIFEFFELTDEVRETLHQRISTSELTRAASAAGMRTMFQDGVAKCLAGLTTLEEVRRVTEEG